MSHRNRPGAFTNEAPINPDAYPAARHQISDWWESLSTAAQRRLRQRPYDSVPEHLAQEIIRSALLTTGSYWPSTYPANYTQFRIPPDVAHWIIDFGSSNDQ